MIKVKAKIFFNMDNRKTPIKSGYRPQCKFEGGVNTSGHIDLKGRKYLYPGEEAVVEVKFINKEYLGKKFGVGSMFTFSEGEFLIGKGEVLAFEVIGEDR